MFAIQDIPNCLFQIQELEESIFRSRSITEHISLGKVLKESTARSTRNHEFPLLSSTAKGIAKQQDIFSKQIENDVGYKIVRKCQLVFSPQNLWLGNISILKHFVIGIVSPSYKVFDIKPSLNSDFLNLLLKTKWMRYQYRCCSEQGASVVRRNLDLDAFLQILIPFPKYEIQTRFVNRVYSLIAFRDIALEEENQLRRLKASLLDVLFCSTK